MTQQQIIKLIIFAVVISFFIYRYYNKKNKSKAVLVADEVESPKVFYSINDGNQNEVIVAPQHDKEWFDALDKKYSWDEYDEYDNRFWEYMYQLFDTLPDLAENHENPEFFNSLNRQQKVFYCVLVFNGDTDNGGVSQFFFNQPEFAFAVLESFDELKMTRLRDDYEKCLNEFIGTVDSYAKRKSIFNDRDIAWEDRWKAFTNGYDDIPSAEALEDYYYDTAFKKEFYRTFVDYVDSNIDKFVKK